MKLNSYYRYPVVLWWMALWFCYPLSPAYAEDSAWRTKGTLQAYVQSYDGATEREGTFNAGGYVSAEYLDSATVSAGYNYTFIDFAGNAELSEHLFYLSGRRHFFPDLLPGKLTARLDVYLGNDTLRYRVGSAPTYRGHHIISSGGFSTIEESSDISAYHPQLAFINYAKTFYVDVGYAHSEYDHDTTLEADQLTPTVGFGWNESYDWLQLRSYFITVDNAQTAYEDDQFESLEAVYTHWFAGSGGPQLELVRFSVLAGERVLAVDPDAGVIYSTADKQTGSLTGSVQWKLSRTSKVLAVATYGRYENDEINDEYNSLLFYINLQQYW